MFRACLGLLWLVAGTCVSPAWSAEGAVLPEEYAARRAALRSAVGEGVIVLFGKPEAADELRTGFFQESNFYYLTGWNEPGAILMMTATRQGQGEEFLFLPARDPEAEKWTGRKAAPDDDGIADRTGFAAVLPGASFEERFRQALSAAASIHTPSGLPAVEKIKTLAPLREVADLRPAIARLRMKKSPAELELIRRSIRATIAAHRAAWERLQPGIHEHQIIGTMVGHYLGQGCERSAYTPIVGSGPNSTVLHYARGARRIEAGDVVLMDVGAECAGYAADITRTLPANGRFTARQREIYEIVLGAQKAAIAAVRPGMRLGRGTENSLYQIAYDYIDSHGVDARGERLGKYFTHGIGHHVGLDVHDADVPGTPLEPGMVITIEPGIYIPEENLGIRIEDIVLVTETGAEVLTRDLPKEIREIERRGRR
ncbi:MAG: aminopeptidase P N-terminal domain-containing protein [Bryobacteraceae bacterium]